VLLLLQLQLPCCTCTYIRKYRLLEPLYYSKKSRIIIISHSTPVAQAAAVQFSVRCSAFTLSLFPFLANSSSYYSYYHYILSSISLHFFYLLSPILRSILHYN
jgi:hypothetical protein